jgi:hypothetical protein
VDTDEPIECSELFGFDFAHFRYCAALWVFKEQVGLCRLSEIMVQAYDLENCEPIGKC